MGNTAKFIIYKDLDRKYRWTLRTGERVTIAFSERGYREKSKCAQEIEDLVLEYPDVCVRDATVANSQTRPLSEWLASQPS